MTHDARSFATREQTDAFADHLNRIGPRAVAGALGFRGDHDDPELDENLLYAFGELGEAGAEQALRVLAMTRRY